MAEQTDVVNHVCAMNKQTRMPQRTERRNGAQKREVTIGLRREDAKPTIFAELPAVFLTERVRRNMLHAKYNVKLTSDLRGER